VGSIIKQNCLDRRENLSPHQCINLRLDRIFVLRLDTFFVGRGFNRAIVSEKEKGFSP
jgi:hypothetical protein